MLAWPYGDCRKGLMPRMLATGSLTGIKLYMERIIEYHEEKSLSFIRDCFLTGNGILQPGCGFIPPGGRTDSLSNFRYRKFIPFIMSSSGNSLGHCSR